MKKILLMIAIASVSNTYSWNLFAPKKSTIRKAYDKTAQVLSPLAPTGIQLIGAGVVPLTIACVAPSQSKATERLITQSIVFTSMANTGLNMYQYNQSKKENAGTYALVNQAAIVATVVIWTHLGIKLKKAFKLKYS